MQSQAERYLFQGKIPTVSFYYTAALEPSKAFEQAIAEFQLTHLAEHGQWLSDAEARAKLQETAANPHGSFCAPSL